MAQNDTASLLSAFAIADVSTNPDDDVPLDNQNNEYWHNLESDIMSASAPT